MENKTKGQLERMQWYNNLCKETGYEPLRGNPYAENSPIVEFEKLMIIVSNYVSLVYFLCRIDQLVPNKKD